MYLPQHFNETRIEELHRLIIEYPLGALVLNGPAGLDANHLPFELDPRTGDHGRLLTHVARANPLWKEAREGDEVLVMFRGASAYVSPNWYREPGRHVPTWNYQVVHVYGRLRIRDDASFVRGLVTRLTRAHEARIEGDLSWKMTDAPAEYIDRMLAAVVGIEIEITRIVGKSKLSQNREESDRLNIAEQLRRQGNVAAANAMTGHAGADLAIQAQRLREERDALASADRGRHLGLLGAIVAVHVVAFYLLSFLSPGTFSLDTILETRFIPTVAPEPPPLPDVAQVQIRQNQPIWVPVPAVAITVPADESATAIQQVAVSNAAPQSTHGDIADGFAAEGFVRPRPISRPRVKDSYPRESWLAKEQGTVTVTLCISAQGDVTSAEVASSSGHPRLDQAAIAIGKAYHFAPATQHKKPVPVCLPYTIGFRVN